jgi:arylsulfatase
MVRHQQSAAPGRPFFLYLAFAAAHWPHQVPRPYLEKYRGRYDVGWDVIREQRFARQKALGVVPETTDLPPRNPDVRPWAEHSAEERRVFARLQEAYAGFIDHTDAQIGRLLDALERDGLRENTLIVLISDNGASPEGNVGGSMNNRKHRTFEPDTLEQLVAGYDLIGSERAYNHYPRGWAQASNTPLKWYKRDVHGGGIRDVCLVSWPERISGRGELRTQYHHVVDVTPTVLDLLGIELPAEVNGVPQMPLHGISMGYSFDDADAPTRKEIQYYELAGDRGLWHRGWKAVALHPPGTDFEQDRWELYHVDEDFSEAHDLAEQRPEKLRELIERWWAEAGRYGALPLDDREWARAAESAARRARRRYVYSPGMPWVEPLNAPDITDRSYTITAELGPSSAMPEGVILSFGTWFGGEVLYVKDGRVHFEYVYTIGERRSMVSSEALSAGAVEVRYGFEKTGRHQGIGRLYFGEREVARLELPKTWPLVGLTGGLRCGRDGGAPVSEAYAPPYAFTGSLERVVFELGGDREIDPRIEAAAARAAD